MEILASNSGRPASTGNGELQGTRPVRENTGVVTPRAQPSRRVQRPLSEGDSRWLVRPAGNEADVGAQFDRRQRLAWRRRTEGDVGRRQEGHGAAGSTGTALAHAFGMLGCHRTDGARVARSGGRNFQIVVSMRWIGTDCAGCIPMPVVSVMVFGTADLSRAMVLGAAEQHRRRGEAVHRQRKKQQPSDNGADEAIHGLKSSPDVSGFPVWSRLPRSTTP